MSDMFLKMGLPAGFAMKDSNLDLSKAVLDDSFYSCLSLELGFGKRGACARVTGGALTKLLADTLGERFTAWIDLVSDALCETEEIKTALKELHDMIVSAPPETWTMPGGGGNG